MSIGDDRAHLPLTLGEFGAARLKQLGDALDLTHTQSNAASAIFDMVSSVWGQLPVGTEPAWPNDITDDGTPFEFSVGFEGGRPELRILFESQSNRPPLTQHASWKAGVELQKNLEKQGLCDTGRFDLIADLFSPRLGHEPRFSLWHALVLREGGPLLLKTYLNPEINGVGPSRAIAASAFTRLDLQSAWRFVEGKLNATARLPYISLDMERSREARVKIYMTAEHADDVVKLVSGCANDPGEQAREWVNQLLGREGPFDSRPLLICFSFSEPDSPPAATVHVPIRSYVPNDWVALQRTLGLLPKENALQLSKAVEAFSSPSPRLSQGVITYVSLRFAAGALRVTTYLAPRAYAPARSTSDAVSADEQEPTRACG